MAVQFVITLLFTLFFFALFILALSFKFVVTHRGELQHLFQKFKKFVFHRPKISKKDPDVIHMLNLLKSPYDKSKSEK
jgi:hypothetical protein